MALSILADKLDKDGEYFRRRQVVQRTAPGADPATITIAKPYVSTILAVAAGVITDGTEGINAPEVAVAQTAPGVYEARIKTLPAAVTHIWTEVVGF